MQIPQTEARMWVEVVVGEPVDFWSTPAEIQDILQDGTYCASIIVVSLIPSALHHC